MTRQAFTIGILDRYIFKDLYKSFVGVALILILIIFANNLVLLLEKVLEGYISRDMLWGMMLFELLKMLSFILPPAFFFAILLSLGRLYRDSEIAAMQASGLGSGFLFRSYLISAVPALLMVALLSYVVMPWAVYEKAVMRAEHDAGKQDIASLETGKFTEYKDGEIIFFAASAGQNKGDIRDVFVQSHTRNETSLISAKEGYQYVDEDTDSHYLVLKNGYRYVGEPGKNNYKIARFYEYGIRIREVEGSSAEISSAMKPTSEIWSSSNLEDRLELQRRFAIPVALLALAIMAVPLSRSMPRQGVFGRFLLAFIVYFCFMNLSRLAGKWMEADLTPLWLGTWWVSLLAIGLAAFIELRDRYPHKFQLSYFPALLSGLRK